MTKARKSYYAVIRGRKPGLYGLWEDCKKQVNGYSGAKYMGFFSREEAVEWIQQNTEETLPQYSTIPAATAPLSPPSSPACFAGSHGGPFYAVARGRQPGIYDTWARCRDQVNRFSGARYKKFHTLKEATEFVAVYGGGGHFSQFAAGGFEPDSTATFSEEWARLARLQGWVRGTRRYGEQRVVALRNELQTHFFASPSGAQAAIKKEESNEEGSGDQGRQPVIKTEDSDEEGSDVESLAEPDHQRHEAEVELRGFQSMCEAVGKRPGGTLWECKRILNQTLVNIVDLIDARRTGRTPVRVWTDFDAFRAYTLRSAGDKTIPWKLAAEDPLLRCFLQNFRKHPHPAGQRGHGLLVQHQPHLSGQPLQLPVGQELHHGSPGDHRLPRTPRGCHDGRIDSGGVVVKKMAGSEEDDDMKESKHRPQGCHNGYIGSESAIIKKEARSEEDDNIKEIERRPRGCHDGRTGSESVIIKKRAGSEEDDDIKEIEHLPRGCNDGRIGGESAIIKKRARSEEDDDVKECGHRNKRIMSGGVRFRRYVGPRSIADWL